MASLQRAQTGNRVYGGVGQSPNRGQVSARGAQGYLQRELGNRNQGGVRNPVGRDGKSDSRSGVASRALNQGFASNGGRPQAGGKKPGGNKAKLPGAKGTKPTVATPLEQASQQVIAPPPPPQIKVNDQGLLELPYSQNMSSGALKAFTDGNEELVGLQAEEQAMQLEAMQGRRDANTQYGQLKTQTLAGNSTGGTAFSSMHSQQIAGNATAYSNTLGDISKKEADFNQNASARRAAIQSSLAMQLASGAQEYGDELGDEAGTLGFGTEEHPTNEHGPAKHPERHPRNGQRNNGPKRNNPPKKNNNPPKKNNPPKANNNNNPPKANNPPKTNNIPKANNPPKKGKK